MTRAALVTGAARGIGAAVVAGLLRDGWRVAAIDRAADDPRLPYSLATASDLEAVSAAGGGEVMMITGDAADNPTMSAAVLEIERAFGGLDAVVAAAGVIAGGVPLWETPVAHEEALVEVNLCGVIAAARAGIPALLRRPAPREGRFIAIASAASSRGLPMLALYGASKAAVAGLIRGLAADLRGTGITANAVSPGSTRTAMLDESARLYGLASSEELAVHQPIERLLEPDEVAAMVVWLAGAGGRATSGANLAVDGGLGA